MTTPSVAVLTSARSPLRLLKTLSRTRPSVGPNSAGAVDVAAAATEVRVSPTRRFGAATVDGASGSASSASSPLTVADALGAAGSAALGFGAAGSAASGFGAAASGAPGASASASGAAAAALSAFAASSARRFSASSAV